MSDLFPVNHLFMVIPGGYMVRCNRNYLRIYHGRYYRFNQKSITKTSYESLRTHHSLFMNHNSLLRISKNITLLQGYISRSKNSKTLMHVRTEPKPKIGLVLPRPLHDTNGIINQIQHSGALRRRLSG